MLYAIDFVFIPHLNRIVGKKNTCVSDNFGGELSEVQLELQPNLESMFYKLQNVKYYFEAVCNEE